ncbi:hypothetical protein DFP72DRAFT_1069941 [Ephemerocybe angulata]|uniref:Acetyl-CoA synthetase-like protein n=1 Tax=Ephemerocybe angulata TaxID=980116 RepID=A0A8H6HT70_9AGAR|nr:hypothetical protein DFP72DRAFT_1069941 [Tulosesus angulatus]
MANSMQPGSATSYVFIPLPTSHRVSSFRTPPLDLTLPGIYDFHRLHNPTHPIFCWDTDDGVHSLTWATASQGIHNVARRVASAVGSTRTVVAILAVTDQISYFALIAGIIRAGHCAFPISPRNSDAAVADLLHKAGAKYVFVSGDRAIQKLAQSTQGQLDGDSVVILGVPSFREIYETEPEGTLPDVQDIGRDATALILHSSGSTSFPKPIHLSHRNLVEWGLQPYFGEVDINGRILSNHALPLFHAMGIVSTCWALTTGVILSNFAPGSPPQVPTPESTFESIVASNSQLVFCVPTFLEEWGQDDDKVEFLRKIDAIMFGGAPIRQTTGDALYGKGVKLFPFYGATELGGSSQFLLSRPPEAGWEYFKLSPHTSPVLIREDGAQGISRLYFKPSPTHSPATLNADLDGERVYDTKDLLVCHPTERGLWKIHGRADDQIMHSTGEKTNPVPIEAIITRHPNIRSAIVFGRGRFQAGVLIETCTPFLPEDENASFIDDIWSQIKEANKVSPSHSRIFKEMIIVAVPGKPFLYTAKGSVRRQNILDLYKDEISALYDLWEVQQQHRGSSSGSAVDLASLEGCISFVRETVRKALQLEDGEEGLGDGDDIFQHGCDSLQAIWIRNKVAGVVRSLGYEPDWAGASSSNFVYAHPTIAALAQYTFEACNSGSDKHHGDKTQLKSELYEEKMVRKMLELVEKYSQSFPGHTPGGLTPRKEAILLTGSTGGLGSYLLESLVLNPDISKVFVLNRPNGTLGSEERQLKSFRERGIDAAFLDFGKIRFLEGHLEVEGFGLDGDVIEEMRREVTCVMHVAWRVDFNIGISSMEPLIAGTRNLVDFALSSFHDKPPKFLFASSIGVLRNYPDVFAPEEAVPDPKVALGSGYPESKWVAEQLLVRASQETALRPVIVRIGQLSGGRNGYWSPSEWVPSIVRSGELLGCLPRSPGLVSWLPVHTAASAFTEIRACEEPFLHFVHPAPIPWNDLVELLAEALLVPQVSYKEWLGKLEECNSSLTSDLESNPALKLLEFYQSVDRLSISEEGEAFGFPRLWTAKAVKHARSLHPPVLQPLDRKDVAAWISYWKSEAAGLLQVPGFDAVQYTETLLTSKRGLRPYLSHGSAATPSKSSRRGRSGSTKSTRIGSSSAPMSGVSSQIYEQERRWQGVKAQISVVISNLMLWIRLALSLPLRLLANFQSLERST